jgi:hypothetical protein
MTAQSIPNPHTDTAAWVAWKRPKIGGHAAAVIAGVHEYTTMNQLYDLVVHGIVDPITQEKEDFFEWRLSLEANIANRYSVKTGRLLRKCGSSLHPDDQQLVCSPDREILKEGDGIGLLEIKSRDPIIWNQIKLSGAPGADWVQTQFYLMVRGLKWGAICEANVSSGKQLSFDMPADLEFHKVLWLRIQEFLADCAEGKRPPADNPDPVRLPAVGGELVTVEQMDAELVGQFKGITDGVTQSRDLLARAKDYHDGVKEAAQLWMLKNKIDVVEGFGKRIYYKEQKGRLTLDKKALARDNPEISLSDYETRGQPFRSFRVFDRPLQIASKGDRS